MTHALRIATRESPLALWQAEHVKARLLAAHPDLAVELVPMTTRGDQLLSHSLSRVGGKGLFVKELEAAMLEDRADIAVHSMKDVPSQLPAGLEISTLLQGEEVRDAFVCPSAAALAELPQGAVVGTASLRRQAQLRQLRPDLDVREVRGNLGTRLGKLDAGEYDALLLAGAGLIRLGLPERIAELFDVDRMLPAIGQGVIGIEQRSDDARTRELLQALHDPMTADRVTAERAMNACLGGACHVPVAGHAVVSGQQIRLEGLVAAPDGSRQVRDQITGPRADADALGRQLAAQLLAAGGREILNGLGIDP